MTANFVRGAKEALELKGLAVVAHGEAVAVASVGEDGEEEGEHRAAEQRGPVGGQPAVVGAGHLGAVAGAAVGVVGGQPPGLQGGGAAGDLPQLGPQQAPGEGGRDRGDHGGRQQSQGRRVFRR